MNGQGIGTKLSTRALLALSLAAITGFAFFLRTYYAYDIVFRGDWVRFKGFDSWYHVRLIENLVQNFPQRLAFDPFTYYPHGQDVFFAPLYDLMAGSLAWVFGAGSPSLGTTETIAAYFPAVLGALVTIPVFFLGKVIFNNTVGLIAAALVIVLPGQFLLRSLLGFTDHHVAETVFSAAALLLFMIAVRSARDREISFSSVTARDWAKLRRPFVYSLLAGVALAVYLLSWVGGALVVGIIVLFALAQYTSDHLRGRPTDYLCVAGVPCFAAAFLLLVPFMAQLAYGGTQAILLLVGIVAFTVLSGISVAMTKRGIRPAYYPVAALLVVGVLLVTFYLIAPSKLSAILGGLRWLDPRGEGVTVGELRPFAMSMVWEEFTTSFYLSLAGIAVLAYVVIRQGVAEKTLLLVWSAVMLLAMLSENRFSYYFAVNVSLLTAYIVWLAAAFISARVIPRHSGTDATEAAERFKSGKHKDKARRASKRRKERGQRSGPGLTAMSHPLGRVGYGIVATLVVFFLVFFPNIGIAINVAGETVSQVATWRDPLLWMRENTPDPFGDPDFFNQVYDTPPEGADYPYPESAYGVMAWWDYGHWITDIAHRIPNSNPHQYGASAVARYFTSQDESSANEMLNELGSRYVIVDLQTALLEIDPTRGQRGNFHGVIDWAGRDEDEFFEVYYRKVEAGRAEPVVLYYPEYYQSMSSRLFLFDGAEVVPENTTYVISYENKRAPGGRSYKEIASIRRFIKYEEAVSYLNKQTGPNFRLVGYSQLESPVPLEKLEHYEMVHESIAPTPAPGQVAFSEVKIFEYTP